MPALNATELKILGALSGAFSEVTDREATGDRSVTIDRSEKVPIQQKIAPELVARKGGVHSNGNPDRHSFNVHAKNSLSTFALADLAIAHPKKKGNELRLYFSIPQKFEANTGDIFYVYTTSGEEQPHVGFMDKVTWDAFWANTSQASKLALRGDNVDLEDEEYQRGISSVAAKVPVVSTGRRYPRDPTVALKALVSAKFLCEIDEKHPTFISAATGKNYVEAHHLVPVSVQASFSANLDVRSNIVALCCTCHRQIHLGDTASKVKMLTKLLKTREDALAASEIKVDIGGLFKHYNVA